MAVPDFVYFIINKGMIDSTHLSLKDLAKHMQQYGGFSQAKLKKDFKLGDGRIKYQLPIGFVTLKQESLKN